MSSEVLLRRPAIFFQPENLLKAAHANIGVVRAAFSPVSLSHTVGTASDGSIRTLPNQAQAPGINAPQIICRFLMPAPGLRSEKVKRKGKSPWPNTRRRFRRPSGRYDALAVKGTVTQQIAAQQSLVNAVAETYRLSNARYTKGIDSYLSVLGCATFSLCSATGTDLPAPGRYSNLVTVYRVLGRREKIVD